MWRLVSHGSGRRMRDHLSARAEMSALSQMDVFRGRTTLPAWVFVIIVMSDPKDPAHGRRRVSALVDCDGARVCPGAPGQRRFIHYANTKL